MLKRALAVTAGIAAAGAIALPAVTNADNAPQLKKNTSVKVADDFFSPTTLTVKKNAKVKFAWDSSNTNSHNVTLTKGPKGVKLGCKTKGKDAYSDLISKCNKSSTGAIGVKFTKKFDVAGKYSFICTIHPDVMKLNVTVKK
jgi:plastocyanin